MYMCAFVRVRLYASVRVSRCVCVFVCMCAFVRVRLYASVVSVGVYVCLCVCVYVNTYVNVSIHLFNTTIKHRLIESINIIKTQI